MRPILAHAAWIVLAAVATATDADLPAAASRDAQRMVSALLAQNHEAYMEFIHPALIERVGGDDAFLALLMGSESALEEFGITLESAAITGVEPIVQHEGRSFAVVLQTMELSNPDGRLETDSFLVGIREAGSADWKFIDGSGLRADPTALDALFPGVLLKLKLPTEAKERFVPDEKSQPAPGH